VCFNQKKAGSKSTLGQAGEPLQHHGTKQATTKLHKEEQQQHKHQQTSKTPAQAARETARTQRRVNQSQETTAKTGPSKTHA
jgi:hypothetical protein